MTTIQDLLSFFDNRVQTDVTVLDVLKAFDTVYLMIVFLVSLDTMGMALTKTFGNGSLIF